ncbi:MAG: hypothetical protein DCF15_22655 [Phormidesmis priestleyi]|uniref:Uncharacterized protein n=1 Tax=Phormidesmis priestleyi TaxID=268141 RepID=A0A2W4WDI2_9CYAN|nr:MAG: hypothetical protein DCF15_22655 [Phormidesmis priestleyi]
MSTIPVTINLPEEIYQRAERFARLINRDVSSVLADTVVSSLPPLSDQIDALPSVVEMSDRAVLELANSTLPEKQDWRLSELLEKQREDVLILEEQQELETLMQIYNEGWLRKTAGLVEAVNRRLMEPLNP